MAALPEAPPAPPEAPTLSQRHKQILIEIEGALNLAPNTLQNLFGPLSSEVFELLQDKWNSYRGKLLGLDRELEKALAGHRKRESFLTELGRLQGLIFLRKLSAIDSSDELEKKQKIIDTLVGAFQEKIKTVNTILQESLGLPEAPEEPVAPVRMGFPPPPEENKYFSIGGGKNYQQKYLSYKAKYLKLKNRL